MKWTVSKDFESWDSIFETIQESEIIKGLTVSSKRRLFTAMEEAASNIIIHSKTDISESFYVTLKDIEDYVEVVIENEGIEFNPLNHSSPDLIESNKENKPGGLGIYMIKQMVDDLTYMYSDGFNMLTMKMYKTQNQ